MQSLQCQCLLWLPSDASSLLTAKVIPAGVLFMGDLLICLSSCNGYEILQKYTTLYGTGLKVSLTKRPLGPNPDSPTYVPFLSVPSLSFLLISFSFKSPIWRIEGTNSAFYTGMNEIVHRKHRAHCLALGMCAVTG